MADEALQRPEQRLGGDEPDCRGNLAQRISTINKAAVPWGRGVESAAQLRWFDRFGAIWGDLRALADVPRRHGQSLLDAHASKAVNATRVGGRLSGARRARRRRCPRFPIAASR